MLLKRGFTAMTETCPICDAHIFGAANCVICAELFLLRHPHPITCAKKSCMMARQLQVSKRKLAGRFPGQTITCAICKTKMPKTRVNQMTCLGSECIATHGKNLAKRSR